ncbi:zinc finger protein 345-like [Anopheles cruzii]|uniref:zinc finger protein 345-like n=1 Tax=Anopheles cruzii TaxID=68878 RepID=UPI0022EC645A|nr:zinc finger protein 345-like [Anopheles cruzii]XP_052860413.1 zinc finger protein 345-like [Anopheles cruzii]
METIMHLKEALSFGDLNMCRLCLSPDVASESLTQDESGQYLIQKIFDCTSVQIMPLTGIASVLCTDCKTRVEDFYLFRFQCIKNNQVLNEFAAELSKSPLVKSESQIVELPLEPVPQTDGPIFISLNEDPPTHEVDNINLDHTYSAKETNIPDEVEGNDGFDLPEVKLEPDDELSSETLKEGDPLQTALKQPTKTETHEDITMNSIEESNQCPNSPGPSTVRVPPEADAQLLPKPKKRAHIGKPPFVCKTCNKEFKTRDKFTQHTKTHNKDEQHQCPHCTVSFVARQRLLIHLRYHTGERPFKCQVCHKAFVSQPILNSHSKIHNEDQQYQCPHCPAKFASKSRVPIHIRTNHTGEKPFICKVCNKAYAASFQLTHHMHIHSENQRFLCHCCSAKFNYASSLKGHLRSAHPGEIPSKIFECKVCNKCFKSSASLLLHRKIHTNDRRYHCSHCPAKFYNSSSLKIHIRCHTGERPFVCKVCDKAFYTPAHLRGHAKTHNKDEQHQCRYCLARFDEEKQLQDHILTHGGETAFICKICSAKFSHAKALKSHIRRAHGAEELPRKTVECNICHKVLSAQSIARHKKSHQPLKSTKHLECNICHKVLGALSSLHRHKKTHQPKLEEDKKYPCTQCPAKFYESGALQRHIRHHTGERPYKCKICGKAFHTSTNLKTHGKTHSKGQQYQCSHCPAMFAQSSLLKAHMASHTGDTSSV